MLPIFTGRAYQHLDKFRGSIQAWAVPGTSSAMLVSKRNKKDACNGEVRVRLLLDLSFLVLRLLPGKKAPLAFQQLFPLSYLSPESYDFDCAEGRPTVRVKGSTHPKPILLTFYSWP